MKKINLYLDDLRICPKGFVLAKTVEEAKNYLNTIKVSILSLDHDLGTDKNGNLLETGYDFVKYFCENGLKVDAIYIHTDNSVGRENMYKTLLGAQNRGFISSEILIYPYPYIENRY